MLETLKVLFLLVAGLALLIKGGGWFVDSATGIARRFKMPEILVGATVVSIGTTLPEVMVSLQGAINGQGAMAYGNATGSIICNTALIAAITITVAPSVVDKKSMKIPIVFFCIASAIFIFAAYFLSSFSRVIGILLLSVFIVYMIYAIKSALNDNVDASNNHTEVPRGNIAKEIIMLVIGAVCIAIGARFLINSATSIAQFFGVPESVIALTIVALGTSLPEFVTAITSLVKGHGALSLGNIIGANLFNLVFVSGVAITTSPFALPSEKTIFGHNASLVVDMPVMLLVMSIMCVPSLIKGKLFRTQGIILLCIYAAFFIFQFAL